METTETEKNKKKARLFIVVTLRVFMLLLIWQFLISFTYYIDYKHNLSKQLSTNLTHL
jgi:hypothetical protein